MAHIINKLAFEIRQDYGEPVDTVIELKAVLSPKLQDKTTRYLKEKNSYYTFHTDSTDAPNDDDVIKPDDIDADPGRWIRAHQLHEQMTDLQGGMANDRFHVTGTQHTDLTGGGAAGAQHGHSTSVVAGTISDTQHGNRGGALLPPLATPSDNGFLSKEDKKIVDDLAAAPILIGFTLSTVEVITLAGTSILPASSVTVPAGIYSKIWIIASAHMNYSTQGTSEIQLLANGTPIASTLSFATIAGAGPGIFAAFAADNPGPGANGGANCMQVIIQDGAGPGQIDLSSVTQTISWGTQTAQTGMYSANRALTVFGFK